MSITIKPGIPIGVQLNNPLNMRPMAGGRTWDGQPEGEDGIFRTGGQGNFVFFKSIVAGFRAAAINVKSYKVSGILTPTQIISTWAPGTENNTAAYIEHVKTLSGLDMDAPLPVTSGGLLAYSGIYSLLWSMTQHEQGATFDKYFKVAQLNDGLRLAGVGDVPVSTLHKNIAKVGTGVGIAASVAPQIQSTLSDIAPHIAAIPSPFVQTLYHGIAVLGSMLGLYGIVKLAQGAGK